MHVIISADKTDTAKTHQLMVVRYAKSCSHLFINNHAMGAEIKNETIINRKKSFDNMNEMSFTEAPSTLRMPISFIFCSIIKESSPTRPSTFITIDKNVNRLNNC